MSKETRTVRPFLGLDALEHFLDRTLLHFGRDACEPGSTMVVDVAPHEFLLRPVNLTLAPDDASFEALTQDLKNAARDADIPIDALALLVVAWSSFLRTTSVVKEVPLGALDSLERTLLLTDGTKARAFRAPFDGFVVECYLHLDRALSQKPLRPHMKGTWLSRARFAVSTSHGPAVLPPMPLTNEIRSRLELPPRTMRYVHFGDHDLLAPFRDSEEPVYYIDEDILGQITARKGSQASKALQSQLALDFVTAVIRRAASRRDDLLDISYFDVRDSLLGHVVRLAAGAGANDGDRDRVLSWLRTDPEKVVAFAENSIRVGDAFIDALKDGDA